MQIVSMAYANAEQSSVEIGTQEERLLVPWPVRTWHAEAIDAWLAGGNEIQPHVAPPAPVPDASPLQLFDEMRETYGVNLEEQIAALDPMALSRFRLANTIRRQDPFVVGGLQPAMGWTDEQVDALFQAAAARR